MKLLDSFTVASSSLVHHIALYHGDLTEIPPEDAVDVLVVSASPGGYRAVPGTLIHALNAKGVSVKALAQHKYIDLREQFACWLSHEIPSQGAYAQGGVPFRHILCFEPRILSKSAEVVGEIFQSLLPFVYGETRVRSLAMPLVATGVQGFNTLETLDHLLRAAVNWFLLDVPLESIRIVEKDAYKAHELKGMFQVLRRAYAQQSAVPNITQEARYDIFISYSHRNTPEAMFIHDELLRQRPGLRIFIDRNNLDTGAAWQQALYEALDDTRHVIAVLTPHYLQSKVCKEEYNIALARHRDHNHTVLLPLYVYSAPLPTYMQMVQFADCREFNRSLITQACERLIQLPALRDVIS